VLEIEKLDAEGKHTCKQNSEYNWHCKYKAQHVVVEPECLRNEVLHFDVITTARQLHIRFYVTELS
jgi:hypothetical protein